MGNLLLYTDKSLKRLATYIRNIQGLFRMQTTLYNPDGSLQSRRFVTAQTIRRKRDDSSQKR